MGYYFSQIPLKTCMLLYTPSWEQYMFTFKWWRPLVTVVWRTQRRKSGGVMLLSWPLKWSKFLRLPELLDLMINCFRGDSTDIEGYSLRRERSGSMVRSTKCWQTCCCRGCWQATCSCLIFEDVRKDVRLYSSETFRLLHQIAANCLSAVCCCSDRLQRVYQSLMADNSFCCCCWEL